MLRECDNFSKENATVVVAIIDLAWVSIPSQGRLDTDIKIWTERASSYEFQTSVFEITKDEIICLFTDMYTTF